MEIVSSGNIITEESFVCWPSNDDVINRGFVGFQGREKLHVRTTDVGTSLELSFGRLEPYDNAEEFYSFLSTYGWQLGAGTITFKECSSPEEAFKDHVFVLACFAVLGENRNLSTKDFISEVKKKLEEIKSKYDKNVNYFIFNADYLIRILKENFSFVAKRD